MTATTDNSKTATKTITTATTTMAVVLTAIYNDW